MAVFHALSLYVFAPHGVHALSCVRSLVAAKCALAGQDGFLFNQAVAVGDTHDPGLLPTRCGVDLGDLIIGATRSSVPSAGASSPGQDGKPRQRVLSSFAVSRSSVVMSNPTAVAWRSTKRLLRHMTSLQGKHLQCRRGESEEIGIWAQSDDLSSDGRSQHGHLQRLSQKDRAYRWKSGRIPCSLISTGATEPCSLSERYVHFVS